jgi:FdhD protein
MSEIVTLWNGSTIEKTRLDIINEEPLAIRVQGQPYAIVMRTPGDDIALAAGFALTEGLIDTPDEIVQLACCDAQDANTVTVTLTLARQQAIAGHLDRRGYISQTSCGICGKALVADLIQQLDPVEDDTTLPLSRAEQLIEQLNDLQPLRRKTAASHATAIYNGADQLLAVAEDVGRHNALDKAIGRLFLDRQLGAAKVAALSSRVSYELVQKAARAGIPIVLGVSRPTQLAVTLAGDLNMTLATWARPSGLYIYTHPHRLTHAG